MTIRLLLADDHELVREGLRATFQNTDIAVIGEATTGNEAIRLAASHQADVMLLDLSLPDGDGFAVLQQMPLHRSLAIVIYSMHDREHHQRRARELGANGYVTKLSSRDQLIDTIRAASRGESCWSVPFNHSPTKEAYEC